MQRAEEGVSYELNWSICGSGVVPLGKAFRNMRLPELAAVGDSCGSGAPSEASFASVEKEVTGALGGSSTTLYVQDCALGTVLSNEVPVRIVTDNAAAAAMFASRDTHFLATNMRCFLSSTIDHHACMAAETAM